MAYVEKPYLVKRKYYSERYFRNVAFFEDVANALKEFEELRRISLRRQSVWAGS